MTLSSFADTDIALAVRRNLVSLPDCRAVLGPLGNTESTVWLFTRELGVVVEGSSQIAAVLTVSGPWTRPNLHNTARFPRLLLELYSDPSRNNGEIVRPDAESSAWEAWEVFNKHLHRTDSFSEFWGLTTEDPGLRVFGSQLLSEPEIYKVPDWDGGRHMQAYYGLNIG